MGEKWDHDMYEGDFNAAGGGGGRFTSSSKLLISNLDYGVSNADIKVCSFCASIVGTCTL